MTTTAPQTYEHFPENALTEAFLQPNLIKDDTVAGFEGIAPVDFRVTGEGSEERPHRIHRFYKLELDGYSHAIEVTDPLESDPKYVVVSCPGFTEHIRGDIRKKMHSHTSYAHPDARVISIESNGIGKIGDRYQASDHAEHDMDAMGRQRQKIAQILAGDRPVFLHGTSMGSVITQRLAEYNASLPTEQQIDIAGIVWLTPALVEAKRTPIDMAVRFPIGLGRSLVKRAVCHPVEFMNLAGNAVHSDLSLEDAPAMLNQIIKLLGGTALNRTEAVIKNHQTVVIMGKQDSLGQRKVFKKLEQQYPEQLKVIVLNGRGHELGALVTKACIKMRKESQHLVDQVLEPAA